MYYKEIRKLILDLSFRSGTGHIGSNLSICDLIWCLYDSVLNVKPSDFDGKKNNERDRFILSKGHAALAWYVALYLKGFITKEEIESYCDHHGTYFGAHPKHYIKGVEFSTGSLGQGITFANGAALAAKIQNSKRKVYCLISDGEINEGSCWEAFLFAGHRKLNNLVLIYDRNSMQCLGETKNIAANENINEKMTCFGFEVFNVDGHNHEELKNLYKQISEKIDHGEIKKPVFINAKTVSGSGISFMESKLEWHYKNTTQDQFDSAIKELGL